MSDEQVAAQGDGSPQDVTVAQTLASPDQEKSLAELRFDEVKALHQEGHSQREIARRLSMSRRTVERYVALDTYPERAAGHHSTSRVLDYLPYLSQRWQEGCRDARQLFTEIEMDGFSGSYSSVWRCVNRYLKPFMPDEAPKAPMPAVPRLSARQAAWLLMHDTVVLSDEQRTMQAALLAVSNVAAQAYPLVQAFRHMISQRQVEALDPWLHQAERSGIPALRRSAISLRSDYQAVKAALVHSWSNGPVEGPVNRLKLIKRQAYGRASFALLRSRVLGSLRRAPAEP